jgi:DNA-binding cell septation regulator SpoVG
MNIHLDVSSIHLRVVENGTGGLIAWASCVVAGAIKLDNIGVRRGDRGLYLTFPRKENASGEKHPYYHPVSLEATQALQDAIVSRLAALARAAALGDSGR